MNARARHYGGNESGARPRSSPRPKLDGHLGAQEFFELLRRRTRSGAEATDRAIERRSLAELTVMMCDSSGFSRKTHEYGILQFLAVMTRCYDRLIPILERRGGLCLSHNADNILAVFEDTPAAVRAAVDMHRWLKRRNAGLPEPERFNICIGLHHGSLIRLMDNVFGATVNVAARLGEDVAGKDEIVLTARAAERARGACRLEYSKSIEIGGRPFELYQARY